MSDLVFESVLIIWVGVLTYHLIRAHKELKILTFVREQVRMELEQHSNRMGAISQRIADEHLHFEALHQAVISHLHASGTVYGGRIWDTYAAAINENADFDERELPEHLPLVAYNPPDKPKINIDDYNKWRRLTESDFYMDNPNQRVDSDYSCELADDWV